MFLKKFLLKAFVGQHIIEYPTPLNLNYLWSFVSAAKIFLIICILTYIATLQSISFCEPLEFKQNVCAYSVARNSSSRVMSFFDTIFLIVRCTALAFVTYKVTSQMSKYILIYLDMYQPPLKPTMVDTAVQCTEHIDPKGFERNVSISDEMLLELLNTRAQLRNDVSTLLEMDKAFMDSVKIDSVKKQKIVDELIESCDFVKKAPNGDVYMSQENWNALHAHHMTSINDGMSYNQLLRAYCNFVEKTLYEAGIDVNDISV